MIESPTEGDDGVFDSPRITFTNGTIAGESNGSIASATLTDVTVLDPEEVRRRRRRRRRVLFETAEATGLKITRSDEPGEVTVGRIYMETGNVVDNVPQDEQRHRSRTSALPPEVFAGSEFTPATIGYDKLVLDITWDGSRDPAAKTHDGARLHAQHPGRRRPEDHRRARQAARRPTTLNDADAAAKAAEIEVHTVTVRYDDSRSPGASSTCWPSSRASSREDYAKQIAGALPFLLAALNNPEFQNEVAGAVGTFLQDPKSLTIKLEPASPVTGGEIMGLVGTAPQTLPDRLNASITANTPN